MSFLVRSFALHGCPAPPLTIQANIGLVCHPYADSSARNQFVFSKNCWTINNTQ